MPSTRRACSRTVIDAALLRLGQRRIGFSNDPISFPVATGRLPPKPIDVLFCRWAVGKLYSRPPLTLGE
jgi:hypothetical protein